MRATMRSILCAAVLIAAALPAHAQFGGFSLPNLPIPGLGGGSSSNTVDVNKLVETGQNIVKSVREPTVEEELSVGRELAGALLGARPLDPDQRLQRYVNNLGMWLAQQTERPDLPWTFGVIADPGFNAFAAPGGTVFVTRGLVDRMRNEAELAGVLAHEIAHVLRRHHMKAVQNGARASLGADIIGAQVKMKEAELKTFMGNIFRKMYGSGLDQADEYEADQLGVVIAARAGYDPYGLPAVLQMLESHNGNDGAFALMFRTHPSPADRISQLDRRMGASLDNLRVTQGKPVAARLPEFAK